MTTSRASALSRREFSLGAAFLVAGGAAAIGRPRTKLDLLGKAKLEAVIPETLGNWQFVSSSGLVVPPEDQLSRALYSQLLTRVYSNSRDTPMMLLIAQSGTQTGILQIHRPEVCYSAGGYRLSGMRPHSLRLSSGELSTIALEATQQDRTEQLVYWTRIGHHLPLSWVQQRQAVAVDNLRGIIPDAVLVRVSTLGGDSEAAVASIDAFVRALFASVSPQIRHFLLG